MLEKLSNVELLNSLCELVKIEKSTTLKVLEYLSEVDSRKLWLSEGYSSLFDFCIRYLKYTEGEAFRRIQGSRTLKRFEVVKPLLEKEELSLTGLTLLSPHLTEENIKPVLEKAKNKSVREIEKVINEHFPEIKKKPKLLQIELDEELESLLKLAQEKTLTTHPQILFKKILRDFTKPKQNRTTTPMKHTRYVPLKIKQAIAVRDQYQCTYQGANGIRCTQKSSLEIDHIRPWGMGGSSWDPQNLRLLCRAHNRYKAKLDFPDKIKKEPVVWR